MTTAYFLKDWSILFYACTLSACLCVHSTRYPVPLRPEDGIVSPGTWVIEGLARNGIQIPCMNDKYSSWLSYLYGTLCVSVCVCVCEREKESTLFYI